MPEEDGKVELTTSNCKMPVPFVCHVDFECFTEKIETCESNLFLFLFFYNMILTLTTLRFLSWDSLRILRYTTYLQHPSDTINIMVLTLFYLYYVQCDNAHIFRGTSFTHTQKRETYSKKINSCYERQKG